MKMIDSMRNKIEYIETNYFKEFKYKENNFTRNRKLPPKVLFLQMFSNKGKSLKNELENFYAETNVDVSVWGYEKRRLEFDPLMIKEMNKDLLKDYYSTNSLKKIKGYFAVAIDGSDINVPSIEKNYEEFGRVSRKNVDSKNEPCLASISTAYDCMNQLILDSTINKYKYPERLAAECHIRNAKDILRDNKSIFIFDRGYFSFKMLSYVMESKFLFRLSGSTLKNEKQSMQFDDEIIKVKYDSKRRQSVKDFPEINNYLNNQEMNFRFIRVKLPSGENEYLLTNLYINEFSKNDILDLYHLRWGVETAYRTLKSQLKLEEFSGRLPNIIKQDVFLSIMAYNVITGHLIDTIVPPKNNSKGKPYTHKMAVNKNYSIGVFKTYFIKILFEKDAKKRELFTKKMNDSLKKHFVPIRSNRSYKRKRNVKNKDKMSYKKSY